MKNRPKKTICTRIVNACENHGIDSVEKLRQSYVCGKFAGFRCVGKESSSFLGIFFGEYPPKHEAYIRCWCSVGGKRKKAIEARSFSHAKHACNWQRELSAIHNLACADFEHGRFCYTMKPESVQQLLNDVIEYVLAVQHDYKSWHKKVS